MLAAEGLIELRPNRSPRIADIAVDSISELFEALAGIERLAAELAAERATERDLARLRTAPDPHGGSSSQRQARRATSPSTARSTASSSGWPRNTPLREAHETLISRAERARYLALGADRALEQFGRRACRYSGGTRSTRQRSGRTPARRPCFTGAPAPPCSKFSPPPSPTGRRRDHEAAAAQPQHQRRRHPADDGCRAARGLARHRAVPAPRPAACPISRRAPRRRSAGPSRSKCWPSGITRSMPRSSRPSAIPACSPRAETFDIPVVGMAEAAMLTACMAGRRFAIVTFAQARWALVRGMRPRDHGLWERCAGIRMLDTPFPGDLRGRHREGGCAGRRSRSARSSRTRPMS